MPGWQRWQHLDNNEPIKTLHLLEVALAAEPSNQQALTTRLQTLQLLLEEAQAGAGTNYEKDNLRRRVAITEEALATQ